ncbi:RDD family protein [Microbacterium suaedae]|uniref:RDD family protein n=1 Tax=Microbacterium suaedae TaxID=2067813 RepID=UPI000DA22B5F|nr:RDD family protein [Microbacterium suaedae]
MTTIWELDEGEEEVEGLDENGRPDPAYAEALGLIRAPFPRRTLAAAIDVAFLLVMQIPYAVFTVPLLLKFLQSRISAYGLVTHPSFVLAMVMAGVTVLLTLALCVVQGVLHGRKGLTIGKAMMGIRSVNAKTLQKPGFWRIVLRVLIVSAAGIVPLIGPLLFFLSALWDPERRGRAWHDYAAQLWMIDIRKGLDPYDDKRMRIARKMVKVELEPVAHELPSLATADGPEIAYRPAGRVSAGVLGVARSHRAEKAVGLSAQQPSSAPAPQPRTEEGRPILGGYRAGKSEQQDDASAPAMSGMPSDLTGSPAPVPPPQAPAPAVKAPQKSFTRSDPKPVPHPAPAPPDPPTRREARQRQAASIVLTMDTGSELTLHGLTIFGRDPQRPSGDESAHRVPVPDGTRSISKTHFALAPHREGVLVRDLGSTNGTFVVRGDAEREVAAGQPVVAVVGDTVRFGDRTITIGASR